MDENIENDIKTTTSIEAESIVLPEDGSTIISAPAADGQPVDNEAIIVHDTNENGEVIGWHKEVSTEESA